MKCIIIDDDSIALKAIEHCVERSEMLTLVGTAKNAEEGLKLLEKNTDIDLVFLDIEMPEMTGLELIKNFQTPQVIIVTGNKEYASEAFDYNITDFILKPIDYNRFLKAIHKAKDIKDGLRVSKRDTDDLYIKKDSRLIRVNAKDIIYVEALSDYVNIFTSNEKFTLLSTMKSIESRLPQNDFSRIHRSYIIRLDRIKEIEDETISLGEKTFPISRTYRGDFFKKLNLL